MSPSARRGSFLWLAGCRSEKRVDLKASRVVEGEGLTHLKAKQQKAKTTISLRNSAAESGLGAPTSAGTGRSH